MGEEGQNIMASLPGEHHELGRACPRALDSLRESVASAGKCVMSIDQALDGVGIAFFFPNISPQQATGFLSKTIEIFDNRSQGIFSEMVGTLESAYRRDGRDGDDTPLFVPAASPRKKPSVFGHIFERKNTGRPTVFNGLIKRGASDAPEWVQAREIARDVARLAREFAALCDHELKMPFIITLEGMAMSGMAHVTSILPVLGIVYASIWEELSGHRELVSNIFELPISSWKKSFAGKGNLSKAEIRAACLYLGLGRFASDDEQDAVAMCLVASREGAPLKKTSGRILPTPNERREKKAAKSNRRRVKIPKPVV